MNYDLFKSSVVVEKATASAGSGSTRQRSPDAASRRTGLPLPGAPAADWPPRDSASEPLSTEEVDRTVAAFNEVFKQASVSVRYQIDKKMGDLVISLVDRDTQEVLSQVPPEQILLMRQHLEELLGVIFNQTA